MNKEKLGKRFWLWVGLAVVGAGALTYFGLKIYSNNKTAPTFSPTPINSVAAASPSAKSTSSPNANQSPAPTPTPTPTATATATATSTPIQVNNFQLTLGKNADCVPTVAFQLPQGYLAETAGGEPSTGGAIYANIGTRKELDNSDPSAWIGALAYTATYDYQPIQCVNPAYSSPEDYAQRNNIANYSSISVDGMAAIQFTGADGKKRTVVRKSDKNIVEIVLNRNDDVYQSILNSLEFK